MREADLRRLGHPTGKHERRSTKSRMNAMRRLAAAALAAFVCSYSTNAHAIPGSGAGRPPEGKPEEEGRGNGLRSTRGLEFSDNASVSSNDGITARAGTLRNSSEISTRYGIEYSDKNGMDVKFTFRAGRSAGRITDVFIGAEKTVVMTENSILVTLGYMAAEEEAAKVRGGGEMEAGCVEYPRPEELAGEGLVSGVVVEGPGGSVFQAMGRNGWLREFGLDTANTTAVFGFFEPSGDYELLDAGSLAILARPGSSVVHAIYASIEGNSITMEQSEIALFSDTGEHALPEGMPRISGNGRDILLSFDNMGFLITVGEPGNPDSVTVVSSE